MLRKYIYIHNAFFYSFFFIHLFLYIYTSLWNLRFVRYFLDPVNTRFPVSGQKMDGTANSKKKRLKFSLFPGETGQFWLKPSLTFYIQHYIHLHCIYFVMWSSLFYWLYVDIVFEAQVLKLIVFEGQMTYICLIDLGHWFMQWLVACLAPSHYLNQCWLIVSWTLRNKLEWSFNRIQTIFIKKMRLKCLYIIGHPISASCVKRLFDGVARHNVEYSVWIHQFFSWG